MSTESQDFEVWATEHDLSPDFVADLWDKVVDKQNFTRALRMFVTGTMPYDTATGTEPINVAELRRKVAADLWAYRRTMMEKAKQQRKVVEFYNGCGHLTYRHDKPNRGVRDLVFFKDGHIVAFARFESKQGGIYAADNEVMPNFNWNPHQCLARLRKLNKAFYRDVKKAAFADPKEWFDFNNQ